MLISPRAAESPVVAVDVPPDFHQVPLDPSVETRTADQLMLTADMGLSDTAQREALSLYLEAMAVRLSDGNVVGTAFCAVELDGHPSTATLTVAMHPTHTADRGLVALGAAEAFRRAGRYSLVEVVQLGQHPAVTARSERPVLPGDTANGSTEATEAGPIQRDMAVLVPVPGAQHAVLTALSTPCLEDWATYERLLLDVCRSLRVQSTASVLTD